MNTSPVKEFCGLSTHPLDVLGNINDLLASAEVCFRSSDDSTIPIGTGLIEFAREYTVRAHKVAMEQSK